MREYDLIAEWYASERDDQTGVPEVTTLASSIPSESLVLDVGCGSGVPITRALLNAGHRVIGLDSSSAMLALFKQNCLPLEELLSPARSPQGGSMLRSHAVSCSI